MNQIEFIKKWAKEGDRIEDNGVSHTYFLEPTEDGRVNNFFRIEKDRGLFVETIGNGWSWQSPKIYRLYDSFCIEHSVISKNLLTERWELIANYADEKEEESLIDKYCSMGTKTIISEIFEKLLRDFDSRLKALEDKIK